MTPGKTTAFEPKAQDVTRAATIAKRRKDLGIRQQDLARLIDRSTNTVWRYENLKQSVSREDLRRLESILGTLGESEMPTQDPSPGAILEAVLLRHAKYLSLRQVQRIRETRRCLEKEGMIFTACQWECIVALVLGDA